MRLRFGFMFGLALQLLTLRVEHPALNEGEGEGKGEGEGCSSACSGCLTSHAGSDHAPLTPMITSPGKSCSETPLAAPPGLG